MLPAVACRDFVRGPPLGPKSALHWRTLSKSHAASKLQLSFHFPPSVSVKHFSPMGFAPTLHPGFQVPLEQSGFHTSFVFLITLKMPERRSPPFSSLQRPQSQGRSPHIGNVQIINR